MTAKKYENRLDQQRAYREEHKDKIREQAKQWRLNNPKKVKASSDKYIMLRKGIETLAFTPNPLPDKLLLTLHIKLTAEQENYLYQNKEMSRPQLHRAFRKKFNSNINKLQFNFALERITYESGQKLA